MTENRQQVSDTIGQLIINSLFPEGNESQTSQGHSNTLNEALLAYIKITEDGTGNTVTSPSVNDPSTGKGIKGEVKIRYLLASIKRSGKLSGKLFLHKSKMNSNDTFSIGRTWTLDNLRAAYKKHFKRLPKLVNIDDTIVPDYKPSSTPSTPSKPQTAPSTPSKTPITPNTPSNEFDNYVAAASLKDRLAHSNKSNSSLKSIGGKNSRSITPSLSMGGGQSDSNSITNQTDEDDEMKQEEISLINVGELLNDFDWKGSGNAEALEERLLNELAALESANIHAMIESDDRIYAVIEQIDYAISELDNMDQWLTLYTDELNSMGDDIHHIEGQNRGLQVQTANQKALLSELDRLLQSITISDKVIKILKHESMDTPQGVQNIEQAATHLKRVLETPFDDATKDMAAVKELMKSYEYHCNNFCSRFYEYMRAETLLNDKSRGPRHNNLTIQSHQALEEHLLKYRGISLWMKQMDPRQPIYKKETKEYLTTMKQLLFKRELSEEATYVFSAALLQNNRTSTNFGNWLSIDNSRAPWEFKDGGGGKLPPEESFDHSLQTIIPLIITEKNFIEDFFHLGTKKPLPKNPLDGDADIEDIKLYKRLFEHMERLYNFMPDELNSFIEYETWTSYILELVNYQNKCRLIKGWDDLFTKCGEHLNSLTAMKMSPYYKTFEEEAAGWEDKLNRIHLLFDVWIDVQRQWVYLEGIFSGSADIKHLLPVESQRFQNIDTEFLTVMKKVYKSPYVVDVLNISNVQKSLERLADLLSKIQKALGEYLERERSSFPRFYFVGDEDLLEIIGNSKDVLRIQKHFKKMFAGISNILLNEDNTIITGMASREGEEVIFKHPISLKEHPKINDWLTLIEKEMKVSLAEWLTESFNELAVFYLADDLDTPLFLNWIEKYPTQLVVVASQIIWTQSVEKALSTMEQTDRNDIAPLNNALNCCLRALDLLADTVLQDLPTTQRKKCEHLVTEIVHQRDLLRQLIKSKTSSPKDFEWLYQMRFYFNSSLEDPL
ncbi:24274_t:CDS:10, partial [Entrophospora sp. SA101]